MRKALHTATRVFIGFFTVLSFSHADDFDRKPEVQEWAVQAAQRCTQTEHPVVERSDFRWGLSFLEAADLFNQLYKSEKRLVDRYYYDSEKGFVGDYYSSPGKKEPLSIPLRFLYSIKKHIESALFLDYVQWAYFPDMGHNHFFLDQAEFDSWQGATNREVMSRIMSSPNTKMLYHTLEQIQVMDEEKVLYPDAWSQWRYYTRNIVGDNRGEGYLEVHKNLEGSYNTVHEYEGKKYWGAGIYLHANEKGCFSYEHQGKTFYFDVTFSSFPYGGGDEYQ